jgi:hypothetical protein
MTLKDFAGGEGNPSQLQEASHQMGILLFSLFFSCVLSFLPLWFTSFYRTFVPERSA